MRILQFFVLVALMFSQSLCAQVDNPVNAQMDGMKHKRSDGYVQPTDPAVLKKSASGRT